VCIWSRRGTREVMHSTMVARLQVLTRIVPLPITTLHIDDSPGVILSAQLLVKHSTDTVHTTSD
jgi:hypothetical protein